MAKVVYNDNVDDEQVETQPVQNSRRTGTSESYFGIFRTPEEFVQSAVEAGHPTHHDTCLPEVLAEAISHKRECSKNFT